MAIINKKEFTILIRLRQIEKYLQDKIKYFGKNSQDFKLLIEPVRTPTHFEPGRMGDFATRRAPEVWGD